MLRNLFGPRSGSVPAGAFTVTGPYAAAYVPTATILTELHCHTTQSGDSNITPETTVAKYLARGFGALAITDHDKVTTQPTGIALPIQGNELSPSSQHIISINSGYVRGGLTNAQSQINGVLAAGGQCHVAHPVWHTGMSLAEMQALTGNFGFEIYNATCMDGAGHADPASYPGMGIDRWDALLAAGKRTGVWGVAVDDLHHFRPFKVEDMGRVRVFVENSTTSDVVGALAAGNFVADLANYSVTPGFPVLTSSDVSIDCTGATRIEAWGKYGLLAAHVGSSYTYTFDGSEGYVRLVAFGDYTEPFDSIIDRWAAYDGTWNADGALHVSSDDTARQMILRRHRQGDFSAQVDMKMSSGGSDRGQLMFNLLSETYRYAIHIGKSAITNLNNKLGITVVPGSTVVLAYTDFTPTAGTWYTVKMDYAAVTGTIRAKVWATGDVEPDWMVTAVDTRWTFGAFGIRANQHLPVRQLLRRRLPDLLPAVVHRPGLAEQTTEADSTLGLRAGGLSLLVRKSGVQGIDRRLGVGV